MSDNKRIAKNTMFLYFRMFCVMAVSLYTVRITLVALGVEDYGIYQAVGGIVGMLAFLNNALSTGSSRFLTFELGKGVTERLRKMFSTLLIAHFVIALLVTILAEVGGLWYIDQHFSLSADKYIAVMVVFQLSVVTGLMSMTQIPYMAVIIAHEQLKIYAYVSLAESLLKLGIAAVILIVPAHRLEIYALLVCMVQLSIMGMYRLYCYRHYEESHYRRNYLDWSILREVGAFSGWSMFAAVAIALMNQGTLLLLNAFFSPVVVAARVVALQVSNAAQQFLDNFRTAANPQIVKRLAAGDAEGSRRLLLRSMYFSYYLMLVLAVPIIILAQPLLSLWLAEVPEYAVPFLQYSMVQSLFAVFDTSLYTALYAKGRLKENALISPAFGLMLFPLYYWLFSCGYSPLAVSYLLMFNYAMLGLVIKPLLAHKIAGYRWRAMGKVYLKCGKVTVAVLIMGVLLSGVLDGDSLIEEITMGVMSIALSMVVIWLIGLAKEDRALIKDMVRRKLERAK